MQDFFKIRIIKNLLASYSCPKFIYFYNFCLLLASCIYSYVAKNFIRGFANIFRVPNGFFPKWYLIIQEQINTYTRTYLLSNAIVRKNTEFYVSHSVSLPICSPTAVLTVKAKCKFCNWIYQVRVEFSFLGCFKFHLYTSISEFLCCFLFKIVATAVCC